MSTHSLNGLPPVGEEISLRIEQVLLQDVLGTLVMLELEALGVDRITAPLAVQYVDHNLLQNDNLNAEEHLFLQSACERFGIWYSRPGNGISHPAHMQRFGVPGRSLVGSDSHTPAAGSLGMLAVGAGGVEVALALAGHPLHLPMPAIWGIHVTGVLPDWVSAKDVILEMLRRHGVRGGAGRIIEYHGAGLDCLSAMDRHVIANMGAELGATSSVFPSDGAVRRFLIEQGREADWVELSADAGAAYAFEDEIDLGRLEPLIAKPSSPDNVVPVREIAGLEIAQAYVGSSANPGYRDFAVVAHIVAGRRAHPGVSFDINPTTRDLFERMALDGTLATLIHAGARIHQTGCNGCIGMGQAPAQGRRSLRTVPRNFKGRSGTQEDSVYLCSPETAAASAVTGRITDPRTLGLDHFKAPAHTPVASGTKLFVPPLPPEDARRVTVLKTANITSLPHIDAIPNWLRASVLLHVADNVSTDEIMPAGARVLPYWSSIHRSSDFAFEAVDPDYVARTVAMREAGHAIVAGQNYGQGSSRENAAVALRHLGLRIVVALSFSRIHRQNLINFGVLPLEFITPSDYSRLGLGSVLDFTELHEAIQSGEPIRAGVEGGDPVLLRHGLSQRQADIMLEGGMINWVRRGAQAPARLGMAGEMQA